MQTTDSWLLAAVARELEHNWRGARIERVLQPAPRQLCLQLRRPGASTHLLLDAHPPLDRLHEVARRPAALPALPSFGQLARRHLEGGHLLGVQQPGLERVVHLVIQSRDELGNPRRLTLVAELTGRLANLVLVGPDNRVLDALTRVPGSPTGRTVLPGHPYVPPPRGAGRVDPVLTLVQDGWAGLRAALEETWRTAAAAEEKDLLTRTVFGIGPVLAQALIAWSRGAPGAPPPAGEDGPPLARAVGALARSVVDGDFRPCVAGLDGGAVQPLAWPYPGLAARACASAAEACQAAYGPLVERWEASRRHQSLQAALGAARERLLRRLGRQEEELATAGDAERLRAEGELLLALGHLVPRGASRVRLPSLEDPAREVELTLDPSRTAVQNAQRRLTRYRKAKRAQVEVARRLAAGREELAYLEEAALALRQADGLAELEALEEELRQQGLLAARRAPAARGRPQAVGPSPPLAFDPGAGWRILVGRNALGNDRLTLHGARPQDVWLHARQMPGSHVILKAPAGAEGGEPPEEILLAAARCAAYYSAGREAGRVPVDWTRRTQVRKPPGARPGLVLYEGEHTLLVAPEDLPPRFPDDR